MESALLHKATGYDKPVKKAFKVKTVSYDPETGKKVQEKEELQTAEEEMHVPGNTTAQVFWLKKQAAGPLARQARAERGAGGGRRPV